MLGAMGTPEQARGQGLGRYRGAVYTRTWLTTLTLMSMVFLIGASILDGTLEWVVLTPLTIAAVAALWLVPLTVVTAEGVRLVLRREFVAWTEVAQVLPPRPGDEEVRLELVDGRALGLPGVPPQAAPALSQVWAAAR
jgi:hypothetical protein